MVHIWTEIMSTAIALCVMHTCVFCLPSGEVPLHPALQAAWWAPRYVHAIAFSTTPLSLPFFERLLAPSPEPVWCRMHAS